MRSLALLALDFFVDVGDWAWAIVSSVVVLVISLVAFVVFIVVVFVVFIVVVVARSSGTFDSRFSLKSNRCVETEARSGSVRLLEPDLGSGSKKRLEPEKGSPVKRILEEDKWAEESATIGDFLPSG